MKAFLSTLLIAGIFSVTNLHAVGLGKPDINESSPDGKWLFEAHWYGDRGYMWDLKNTRTGKIYFSEPHPADDEILPHQLNSLWSIDNLYVAINIYYGRIVYGINVIHLEGEVPQQATWPELKGSSMIKPEDQKEWDGSGEVNPSANSWLANDTLTVDLDMRAQIVEKASGKMFLIDSSRQISIIFKKLAGQVVSNEPPQYDKIRRLK